MKKLNDLLRRMTVMEKFIKSNSLVCSLFFLFFLAMNGCGDQGESAEENSRMVTSAPSSNTFQDVKQGKIMTLYFSAVVTKINILREIIWGSSDKKYAYNCLAWEEGKLINVNPFLKGCTTFTLRRNSENKVMLSVKTSPPHWCVTILEDKTIGFTPCNDNDPQQHFDWDEGNGKGNFGYIKKFGTQDCLDLPYRNGNIIDSQLILFGCKSYYRDGIIHNTSSDNQRFWFY
jgi:hypothetical protein